MIDTTTTTAPPAPSLPTAGPSGQNSAAELAELYLAEALSAWKEQPLHGLLTELRQRPALLAGELEKREQAAAQARDAYQTSLYGSGSTEECMEAFRRRREAEQWVDVLRDALTVAQANLRAAEKHASAKWQTLLATSLAILARHTAGQRAALLAQVPEGLHGVVADLEVLAALNALEHHAGLLARVGPVPVD